MTEVCRTWRHVGTTSPTVCSTVTIAPMLKDDETLESLLLWVRPRGSHIRNLTISLVDSIRHNKIATEILAAVAQNLESFNLTVSKSTRNRRGLPSNCTLEWLPVLPLVAQFKLQCLWSTDTNWNLAVKMPALRSFEIEGQVHHPTIDLISESSALPMATLETFTARGIVNGLERSLEHLAGLQELNIMTEEAPFEHRFMGYKEDEFANSLSKLTSLRKLTLSDDDMLAGSIKVVRAIGKLVNLQDLSLLMYNTSFRGNFEDGLSKVFCDVTKLTRLGLVAPTFTRWPNLTALKNLVVLTADDTRTNWLPGQSLPRLEHFSLVFKNNFQYWWEDTLSKWLAESCPNLGYIDLDIRGLMHMKTRAYSLLCGLIAGSCPLLKRIAIIEGGRRFATRDVAKRFCKENEQKLKHLGIQVIVADSLDTLKHKCQQLDDVKARSVHILYDMAEDGLYNHRANMELLASAMM